MEKWQVTNSKITYQDKWITLRSDDCKTSNGKVIAPFHVLEYSDWVNIIAITKNKKVITVKEYRHGVSKFVTGLPCGAIEQTDESPESAARRELKEETGFTFTNFVEVGSYYANPANQNNKTYSFLAFGEDELTFQQLDENEDIEVALHDYDKFFVDIISQKVTFQALHLAGLFFANEYLKKHPLSLF